MINREILKLKGKGAFKRNYFYAVIVGLILSLLVSGSQFQWRFNINDIPNADSYLRIQFSDLQNISTAVTSIGHVIFAGLSIVFAIIAVIISIIVVIFVLNVLEVGAHYFFLKNSQYEASLMDVLYGFFNGSYLNIVKVQFLRYAAIILWGLLLVIPGIIKAYEYRFVPYILSEEPDLDPYEALRRSKIMMYGYKWEAFVLDLSFILWDILSSITGGILGVLYVNPYKYATQAEFYLEVKNRQSYIY